jgi:hypothetical protein
MTSKITIGEREKRRHTENNSQQCRRSWLAVFRAAFGKSGRSSLCTSAIIDGLALGRMEPEWKAPPAPPGQRIRMKIASALRALSAKQS